MFMVYVVNDFKSVMKLHKEGLTVSHISKKTNIPKSTVSNWVKGKSKPYALWTEQELKKHNIEKTIKVKNYWKGKTGPNKGKKFTKEHRENMSKSKIGDKNPRWKGDKILLKSGRSRARYMIKKKERKGKDIHHKDGNPLNNSSDNLEVLTRKEHMKVDGRMNLKCSICGKFTPNENYCVSCGNIMEKENPDNE